jgi:hypothetical protein
MKKIITLGILYLLTAWFPASSQVSISTDGSPPDNSAMLDVQSTSKGVLIPRIDYNDKPDPAPTGLMIYVTLNGPYGDSALYYYDGANWKKFTNYKFSIGQRIGGGVVFWLDESGEHGLIATDIDAETSGTWGCYGTITGANELGMWTGDSNTTKIVDSCNETGIAARYCYDANYHGLSDWYLPSKNELLEMYYQRAVLGPWPYCCGSGCNPIYIDSYWSSSEVDNSGSAYGSWRIHFCNGTAVALNKANTARVRCIRKF